MNFIANILPWAQIVLSVLITVLILLQRSDASLGSAFGGSDSTSMYTRRGAEKILFNITIAVAVLFTLSTLLALAISS
ncbi:MAG: preprotein translocase subunit SecG [Candidatus Parcubacteria bacterium]|nr:preprotein translocase subunit SecG [Candidatus Parcubacteria bacterium]